LENAFNGMAVVKRRLAIVRVLVKGNYGEMSQIAAKNQ
jgi:hypothetical protein